MTTLKFLFISKVRVKLIQIFLSQPHELFYVRQLVRMTGEEINAVRRELQHLVNAEFLRRETRGNRLYYWVRKDYLFYDELASMIAKSTGLGQQILKNRTKLGKLHLVMFSGHFVQQEARDPEAIDILIVGEVVLPEINALIQAEEARLKHEINYTVMDKEEFKFRRSQRDPFLLNILMQPRVMIVGSQFELVD